MACLWDFHDVSTVSPWDYGGIILSFFLGEVFVVPMLFPYYFYDLRLAFLWNCHDMSMLLLWGYYWVSLESRLKWIESRWSSIHNSLRSIEHESKGKVQFDYCINHSKIVEVETTYQWNRNWSQAEIEWKKVKPFENQLNVSWNQSKSLVK